MQSKHKISRFSVGPIQTAATIVDGSGGIFYFLHPVFRAVPSPVSLIDMTEQKKDWISTSLERSIDKVYGVSAHSRPCKNASVALMLVLHL